MTDHQGPPKADHCGCLPTTGKWEELECDRDACQFPALKARFEGLFLTPEGATMLTVNILRQWDREKIERFATHLLGDRIEALKAELAAVKTAITIMVSRKPGAAANAVREDYPELAEIIDGAFAAVHVHTHDCPTCKKMSDDCNEVFKTCDRLEAERDALKAENERLRAALQAIIDIGKRDMTNPKYDEYFNSARSILTGAEQGL